MSYVVDISNHALSAEQIHALQVWAGEADATFLHIAFPDVPPAAIVDEVESLARRTLDTIRAEVSPAPILALHIMGEMGLTFALVAQAKLSDGIPCCHSTTERVTEDLPDGTKKSTFRFVQMRAYGGRVLEHGA